MQLLGLAMNPAMIRFAIRADEDDQETQEAARKIGKHGYVHLFTGNRPKSLGQEHNRMIREMEPCAFYHVLNDDVCILTPNWETGPIRFKDQYGPHRPMCWNLIDSGSPDYPIVTREWIEAAGGLFPEYFPFWFDDMTLACVSCLVTGDRVARINIDLTARKTRTQRMRDIHFWYSFYRYLEPERIAWAQSIADKLDLKTLYFRKGRVKRRPLNILADRAQMIFDIRGWEDEHAKKFDGIEANIGDPTAPDESYLQAKAYAEQRMNRKAA